MFRSCAGRFVTSRILRRNMGSHAHEEKYTGLDAIVRKYLPGNHHVALGILGFYGALFTIYSIIPGGKKKAVPVLENKSHDADAKTDAIPSIESPEFAAWIEAPGNLERLLSA